jgi:hypothetical protein
MEEGVVYLFESHGGSAIKRDLELYAHSVHARPVFSYTVVTVFVSFSFFVIRLVASGIL